MAWISPTGHNDPNTKWLMETYAYDGSTTSSALNLEAGYYLELTHSAINCDRVKVYCKRGIGHSIVSIGAYYSATWHTIFSGIIPAQEWTEKVIGSTELVTKVRIKQTWSGKTFYLYELQLWQVPVVAPTVTTQAVTDVQVTTATGNGNITNTGGENCIRRGVCWNTTGNPSINDDKSEQAGSFGTGAFSRSMTGLSGGTKYYVRAYAYNSAGYGYGSSVSFSTIQLIQPPSASTDSQGLTPSTVLGLILSPPLVAPDSEGLDPNLSLDKIFAAPTATIGS